VENANWREILLLQSELDKEIIERARNKTRFLWDTTAYTDITAKTLQELEIDPLGLRKTSFTADEEQLMARNICPLIGPPRGGVYGFKVPELLKERCRPVWSCYINEDIDATGYQLHSQNQIWRLLHEAVRVVQFDGKSMYDQFELEGMVRNFFSFRIRDGSPACLTHLPMGFCQACEIAQLLSLILASFTTSGDKFKCQPIVHIDNFAFLIIPIASTWTTTELEEYTAAVITSFFERCATTNFQLNEANPQAMTEYKSNSLVEKIKQHQEWCPEQFVLLGIQYNLLNKVRCNAPKTTMKLRALQRVLLPNGHLHINMTPRHLSILFGVGRWAARAIGFKHTQHAMFLAASDLGRELHENPALWDKPMSQHTLRRFQGLIPWYNKLLLNEPTKIWQLLPNNTPSIIVDACSKGWGGILVDNNQVTIVNGEWTHEIENSAESEPKGTLKAIQATGKTFTHLIIVTDHEPLIWASQSQQAKGWHYYSLLTQLHALWPESLFTFVFVEGISNPADAPSRGKEMVFSEDYCRAMAAAAGMGAACALLNPSRRVPSLLVTGCDH
jgi:hypothetical protein